MHDAHRSSGKESTKWCQTGEQRKGEKIGRRDRAEVDEVRRGSNSSLAAMVVVRPRELGSLAAWLLSFVGEMEGMGMCLNRWDLRLWLRPLQPGLKMSFKRLFLSDWKRLSRSYRPPARSYRPRSLVGITHARLYWPRARYYRSYKFREWKLTEKWHPV